jgi:hypothetical protein
MHVTVQECLAKAREYLAMAQTTGDDKLREHLLLIAKELTELAEKLDGSSPEDS